MFEEIMQLIQQHGQQSVVNNADVPNEHNEGIMQEAGSSIISMVQNMVSNGQGDQVANMAQDPNHPANQQLQGDFVNNIMQKFGLNSGTAQNIAASLLPAVLSSFANRNSNTASNEGGGFSSLLKSFGL